MTPPHILLAKKPRDSTNPAFHETLLGHSQSVVESFECLFGDIQHPSRLAKQWLHFFKLSENDFHSFFPNGITACYLHDIGKANSGFQDLINGKGQQIIRHEHLSVLLLWLSEFKQWLCKIPYLNMDILLSAIIGHHLKAAYSDFAERLNPDYRRFEVYPGGIIEVLKSLPEASNTETTLNLKVEEHWSFDNQGGYFNLTPLREDLKKKLREYRRNLQNNEIQRNLLSAVRSALIAADSVGSGLSRELNGNEITSMSKWINDAFSENLILHGQDIEAKVISPRVQQISKELKRKGGQYKEKEFQKASEGLPDRVLLLSSCGSGKTLAAWRWIKGRCAQNPSARVIFLYPTRGTATEGFKDYVSWAPEADAALIHGTSAYELAEMLENPTEEDGNKGKDFTTNDRLYALGYWQRRIFSATVDQFLGFMQYSYRSTCLLPLLADAVVVIDEVHSFDKPLFSVLKRFLKSFELPVLCMTASLPPSRIDDLKECGLNLFPPSLEDWPDDLKKSAEMPRYRVRLIKSEEEARQLIAIERKKKVLWVVNTVDRCQAIAMKFEALCYHSRFRLKDRQDHHNDVISQFKSDKSNSPSIAVTTQVCEMSLDLDTEILITESAPITSLIQRMGRCNRHAQSDSGKIGEVFIYAPENIRPYKKEELEGLDLFLREVDGRDVSQLQLEELLEKYGPSEIEVEKYAAFLESGPWAQSREESLREDNEFTVNAVLDSDVLKCMGLRAKRKPIDGLIVPVPRKIGQLDSRLPRWLSVAPSNHYSPNYGFFKNPLEEHHD